MPRGKNDASIALSTPKADGKPRCIIKAALIRKTKRHGVGRAPEPPEALEDQWPPSQLRKHGGYRWYEDHGGHAAIDGK